MKRRGIQFASHGVRQIPCRLATRIENCREGYLPCPKMQSASYRKTDDSFLLLLRVFGSFVRVFHETLLKSAFRPLMIVESAFIGRKRVLQLQCAHVFVRNNWDRDKRSTVGHLSKCLLFL